MRRVYMDHNATTPVRSEVLAAMMPFFQERFGNASSVHTFGQESRAPIEEARDHVAALIGARVGDVYFTSGGTESDNMAVKGIAFANRDRGNHIITTEIEHSAVLRSCAFLEQEGFSVTYLPVDRYGLVHPDDVARAVTDRTILITIMHANNEIGTIQPVGDIGAVARDSGVYFHSDAVQSAGKIPIDVEASHIDLLSISAHKFYGPKGVGAIYIRKGIEFEPTNHGGHHEKNMRSGTENTTGIIGLGRASELAHAEQEAEARHLTGLRERLQQGITEEIEDCCVNGHPEQRLPGTLNVSFPGAEGESLILSLDLKSIAVSSGSACTSGSIEPSHVLAALGLDPQTALSSLRFSLGRGNTMEDVDYVMNNLPEVISRIRGIAAVAR
ncbi:MAG: cysteine desulfurase NifS [Gemmatimonadota bacterium]|nr:cysteine desulfurase NifS [Gemmatimonadota bacterium]